MRRRLSCDSKNAVYVVSCTRCWVQGVGECENPRKRLSSYIAAVRGIGPSSCRVHAHFLLPGHTPEDIHFMLVDAIPPSSKALPSTYHSLRLRLEREWRLRLRAVLNAKVDLWHSFPGASQARRSALETSQATAQSSLSDEGATPTH